MNKTLQEQAQELIDSFKPFVQGHYIMSDDEEEILEKARKCAHIAIDREIKTIKEFRRKPQYAITMVLFDNKQYELQRIKQLIDLTT